jgi:SAM-dependent methyltransferase
VADVFLDWLSLPPGLHWLDVGCGTGALSEGICGHHRPSSLIGCDPSPDFVSFASRAGAALPARFVVAGVDDLPGRDGGFDVVVSGLVLNFLPRPLVAVRSMKERLRPGGTLAAYVWDYAEGMQFLRLFWDQAIAVHPQAADLDEANRFPLCQPDRLASLFRRAGLVSVSTTSLQIDTVFASFDDYWAPFLAGTGPAPSLVAALPDHLRGRLADRLRERLDAAPDGLIRLEARAFGVVGVRAT